MIVDGKQRVLKNKAKKKLRLNQNEQKTGNTGCKVQIPSSAVKYEKKLWNERGNKTKTW